MIRHGRRCLAQGALLEENRKWQLVKTTSSAEVN